MKLPFHLAVEYAHKNETEIHQALAEFFEPRVLTDKIIDEAGSLFSEWLIFEFKSPRNMLYLSEYILNNPDNLPEAILGQLTQTAETQFFSQFQILKTDRKSWVEIENIFTGKVYQIFDISGSQDAPEQGIVHARIAKIDGKWYFVGGNPLVTSLHLSDRAKKAIQTQFKTRSFSIKETAEMILERSKNPPPPPKILSVNEIERKRVELKKNYQLLSKKYPVSLTFKDLLMKIYNENSTDVMGFWKDLTTQGVSREFLINNIQLFQDIWNFFPHQVLSEKSPIEMFADLKNA